MQLPPDLLEMWVERRPLWQRRAACADLPWYWFFTDNEDGSRRGEDKLPGRKVCQRCPVREECLAQAMRNNERHGIFGGYTSRERQKLRRSK